MGNLCFKDKKTTTTTTATAATKSVPITKNDAKVVDHDRQYNGRKPADDSWVKGGSRKLPEPVAIIHPIDGSQPKNPPAQDMSDQHQNNKKSLLEQKSSDNQGQPQQRTSTREIKINDIRNNLKETVKNA